MRPDTSTTEGFARYDEAVVQMERSAEADERHLAPATWTRERMQNETTAAVWMAARYGEWDIERAVRRYGAYRLRDALAVLRGEARRERDRLEEERLYLERLEQAIADIERTET
jgi:hypothetical protein